MHSVIFYLPGGFKARHNTIVIFKTDANQWKTCLFLFSLQIVSTYGPSNWTTNNKVALDL